MGEKTLIPIKRNRSGNTALRVGIGALTIILVISIGFTTLKSGATFAGIKDSLNTDAMAASAAESVGGVGDFIENIVSPELVYNRE